MEGFRIQPKAADKADRYDYNRECGYCIDFHGFEVTDQLLIRECSDL